MSPSPTTRPVAVGSAARQLDLECDKGRFHTLMGRQGLGDVTSDYRTLTSGSIRDMVRPLSDQPFSGRV